MIPVVYYNMLNDNAVVFYDGNALVFDEETVKVFPGINELIAGKSLLFGTDYSVSFECNSTEGGPAVLTINGEGTYSGQQIIRNVTLVKATLALEDVIYDPYRSSKNIDGKITATIDGQKVEHIAGQDFNAVYVGDLAVGSGQPAEVWYPTSDKGLWMNNITCNVIPAPVKKATTSSINDQVYTGKSIKPTPVIKYKWSNGKVVTLKKGTDYTLSYSKNKTVGKATVTITGKGNFSGTLKKTFVINPKSTTLSSASSPKAKQLKVAWKKQAEQTDGYMIQYSTNKNFKSGNKTVTVKGAKTTKKTISGLKSGKTYYVRIKTYKTVSGTKYVSAWSKAKNVKVK